VNNLRIPDNTTLRKLGIIIDEHAKKAGLESSGEHAVHTDKARGNDSYIVPGRMWQEFEPAKEFKDGILLKAVVVSYDVCDMGYWVKVKGKSELREYAEIEYVFSLDKNTELSELNDLIPQQKEELKKMGVRGVDDMGKRDIAHLISTMAKDGTLQSIMLNNWFEFEGKMNQHLQHGQYSGNQNYLSLELMLTFYLGGRESIDKHFEYVNQAKASVIKVIESARLKG
jgi:hypothetical protein